MSTIECPRCGATTRIAVVGLAHFFCWDCGVQLIVSGGGMTVRAASDTREQEAPEEEEDEQRGNRIAAWPPRLEHKHATNQGRPKYTRNEAHRQAPQVCTDACNCGWADCNHCEKQFRG